MITIEELAAKQKKVAELQAAVYELERAKAIRSVAFYYEGYQSRSDSGETAEAVRALIIVRCQHVVDNRAAQLRQMNVDPTPLLPKC